MAEVLQPSDLAAIARLARNRALLAIEAQRSDSWPEAWLAFAYLEPESDIRGVRRGRIVDLTSLVSDKRAQSWRVTARDGRYAQVAIPGRTFSQQISHTDLDRPFRVFGRFSDSEIAGLVTFVRSSPRKPPIPDNPDGTSRRQFPDQLEGHLPLIQLQRIDGDSVDIWLADSPNSGQHAVLHYQNGMWHLGEIAIYIV
ncbi:MAG TPA: hypothetical protein VFO58_24080 [Vicinamibacterales bacterium]|nr:hypothetical protein [Vicinamibacterales bacterium]